MEGMDTYIDGYCERVAQGFWGEPLNAVTNLAFIIAALISWRSIRGHNMPYLYVLSVILFLIGVGSFLFHTFATAWAATADVLPILAFVLVYLYTSNRFFFGLHWGWSLAITALFFPYALLATQGILRVIPQIGDSSGYGAIALLIYLYAAALWKRRPDVAPGLLIGAVILSVSITFRALDEPLCAVNPYGTHTAWHILNAIMLAWMIRVLRDGYELESVDSRRQRTES